MVFDNILFHNVEELEAADKGLMMWRLPKYVRERVNEGIETITGRYTTGVEFRFKMKTDSVRLYCGQMKRLRHRWPMFSSVRFKADGRVLPL